MTQEEWDAECKEIDQRYEKELEKINAFYKERMRQLDREAHVSFAIALVFSVAAIVVPYVLAAISR